MKHKPFRLIIILSAIFALASSSIVHSESLSASLPYSGQFELYYKSPKYYSLDISEIASNAHVSLSVVGLNNTAPTIFVSLNESNQTPNDTETVDYSSSNSSGSVIFIPRQKLTKIHTIYVGLVCDSEMIPCTGIFNVESAKEILVEPDEGKHIESRSKLEMAGTAVVRFKASLEKDIDRIMIHVGALIDSNQARSKIEVFLNRGDDIPYSGHSTEFSEVAWFEGSTIIIPQDSPLFCRTCSYTMGIKFPQFASLSVEVQTFTSEVKLENKAIFDGLSKDSSNIYYTKVTEGKHDVYVDFRMEQGSLKASINCDSTDGSYGKYVIDKSKEIMLTEQGRSRCNSGAYYITVYGSEESLYTIQTTTRLVKKLGVGNGIPVESEIVPDETVNRKFYVPAGTSGKIIITLEGSSPLKMNINPCQSLTDCKDLLSKKKKKGKTDDFDFELENKDNKQIATIDLDDDASCSPIFVRDPELGDNLALVCAYNIIIHSSQESVVEYTLEVDVKGIKWLLAWVPQDQSVEKNGIAYFGFSTSGTDIARVNIELIKFSGEFEVYVSRTEQYPTKKNSDIQSKGEELITFNDQETDLSGNYYIAIKGLKPSSFSIVASAVTKDGSIQNFIETLTPSIPLEGEIHPKDEYPARFYEFHVALNDEWEGSITIKAITEEGTFVSISVNSDGEVPQSSSSTWMSTNQSIVIPSTDPNFVRQGAYLLGVFVDYSQGRPEETEKAKFSIVYFLNETIVEVEDQDPYDLANRQHMFLSPSSPFTRSLKKGQADYYEMFILPKDDKLTITKKVSAGNVELFVSLDPYNEYPNEKLYTYTTKGTNRNWIELGHSDLAKACASQSATLCVMYVAVIPQTTAASYSISVKRSIRKTSRPNYSITQLEDGRKLNLSLPSDNTFPEIFYFYTLPLEPSFIKVDCSSKKVTLYASVLDKDTDISNLGNINIPSNSSYNYTSQWNLSIPALPAETPMLIMLAVSFEKLDNYYYNQNSDPYSILLDSQMMPISFGTQYNSVVHSDHYRYMTVYVPSSCTLFISAKSLDGQNITVIAAPPYQDELPTIDNSNFTERTLYGSKFILISHHDLNKVMNPSSNSRGYSTSYYVSGTWVIGVYAENSTEFSLLTNCINQPITELEPNKPVNVDAGSQKSSYFIYKPETKMPLNLRARNLPTSAKYFIRQASTQEDFILNLPNSTNYQWLDPTAIDRNACDDCLYIIGIAINNSNGYGYGYGSEYLGQFEIDISERTNQLMDATHGSPVTSSLLANDSNVITLSHYAYQDIYIAINSTAEKLELYTSNSSSMNTTNYLWNTELTLDNETKVLKIPRIETTFDPSKGPNYPGYEGYYKVNLYIEIKNPTSQTANYTIIMLVLEENAKSENQQSSIGINGSQALLFYASTENDTIEVSVNAFTPGDGTHFVGKQDIKAYYWDEDISGVAAIGVPMSRIKIVKEKTRDEGKKGYNYNTYNYGYTSSSSDQERGTKQLFKANSKKGKFFFMIMNHYHAKVQVTTRMTIPVVTQNKIETIDKDSQINVTLIPGTNQTYQILLSGPGVWYLHAYSCKKANTDLAVQNGTEGDYNIIKLESDWVHFYKMILDEGDSTQIISLAALQNNNKDDPVDFVLKSTFLTENKTRDPYSYQTTYRYSSQTNIEAQEYEGIIFAETQPVDLSAYALEDTIFYEIVACPYTSDPNRYRGYGYGYDDYSVRSDDVNRCPKNNCFSNRSEEVYLKDQNMTTKIKLELDITNTGSFHTMLFAHVKSEGKEIRFWNIGNKVVRIAYPRRQPIPEPVVYPEPVQPEMPIVREEPINPAEPYSNESLDKPLSSSSSSWNAWAIIAMVTMIIVVMVVVGFLGYKYLKRSSAGSKVNTEPGEMPPLLEVNA